MGWMNPAKKKLWRCPNLGEPPDLAQAFSFADCGLKLESDSVGGKHVSQNQIIAVVAALIILLAIFVWAVARKGGQEATSQPPQPAPSQQETPPKPQP